VIQVFGPVVPVLRVSGIFALPCGVSAYVPKCLTALKAWGYVTYVFYFLKDTFVR